MTKAQLDFAMMIRVQFSRIVKPLQGVDNQESAPFGPRQSLSLPPLFRCGRLPGTTTGIRSLSEFADHSDFWSAKHDPICRGNALHKSGFGQMSTYPPVVFGKINYKNSKKYLRKFSQIRITFRLLIECNSALTKFLYECREDTIRL